MLDHDRNLKLYQYVVLMSHTTWLSLRSAWFCSLISILVLLENASSGNLHVHPSNLRKTTSECRGFTLAASRCLLLSWLVVLLLDLGFGLALEKRFYYTWYIYIQNCGMLWCWRGVVRKSLRPAELGDFNHTYLGVLSTHSMHGSLGLCVTRGSLVEISNGGICNHRESGSGPKQ